MTQENLDIKSVVTDNRGKTLVDLLIILCNFEHCPGFVT